jgi:hypothetical protein
VTPLFFIGGFLAGGLVVAVVVAVRLLRLLREKEAEVAELQAELDAPNPEKKRIEKLREIVGFVSTELDSLNQEMRKNQEFPVKEDVQGYRVVVCNCHLFCEGVLKDDDKLEEKGQQE